MLRLIGVELRKIWSKKSYKILIVALVLVNVYLITYNNKPLAERYSLSQYGEINKDISNMNEEEKEKYIKEIYETIHGIEIIEKIKMYESKNDEYSKIAAEGYKKANLEAYNKYIDLWKSGSYLKYTDNINQEISLIDSFYEEWKVTNEYDTYIDSIKEQSDVLSEISIFKNSKKGGEGFPQKNIIKTKDDYEEVKPDNIIFSGSEGILKVLDFELTGYLIAVTVFVIGSMLIYEEKEKGLFYITKATVRGKSCNIAAKIMALSISIVIITCIFYMANLIYFSCTAGLGDLSRSIQSIPEYRSTTLNISVLEFVLIVILSKCIVYITVGLVVMLIAIISNYYFYTLIAYIVMFGYGMVMYKTISIASKWNWLKYMNVIGFIKTNKVFGQYLNLNFFGEPINMVVVFTVTICIILSVLVSLSIIIFSKKKAMITKGKLINNICTKFSRIKIFKKTKSKKIFIHKRINIIMFEAYKSGIMYKTMFVLIIFGFISFYKINEVKYYSTPNEIYYKNYMNKLEGKLTAEKEKIIISDKEEFDKIFENIDKVNEMVNEGEITNFTAAQMNKEYEARTVFYPDFCTVYDKYEAIKENNDLEFVYEKGYNSLFGIDSKNHLMFFLQISLVLILMLTPVFAMEYKNDMKKLIGTMQRGRKDTRRAKIIYSSIITVLVFAIPTIKNIIVCNNSYGLSLLTAKMDSIIKIGGILGNLSIGMCIFLFFIAQLLCVCVIEGVVLAISNKCKNIVYGMLVSACILVVPIVLVML